MLTSESHRFSLTTLTNPPSQLQFTPTPSQFTPILQHNDSKLFCLLFARTLHLRYNRLGLSSISVHPGNLLPTNLYRHSFIYRLLATVCRPFTKSAAQAAGSVIFALCGEEPQLTDPTPTYINNCFPSQPSEVGSSDQMGETLWQMTMKELEQRLEERWQTWP